MLGQYNVIRLLGRGGMGEVYEVEHTTLGRGYALKLLTGDFESRPDSVSRFRREARVMANLEHPNIVRVDDFGETDGRYWLRMDLVEGIEQKATEETKNRRIVSLQELADANDGRLSQELLLGILEQTIAGLSFAHGHAAVHRDLKPSNILLAGRLEDGSCNLTVKISDFGLVRMVGEEWVQSQAQHSVQRSLSLGGERTLRDEGSSTLSLLGTYEYMSPEQKRGEAADERSDIYALGLMTFKLLTGHTPGVKPPSRIDATLAPGWDGVVAEALEEEPDERIASCEALGGLLGVVSSELRSGSAPAEREAPAADVGKKGGGDSVGPQPGSPWTIPALNLELMPVARGQFEMGSNDGDQDESPVHTVRLTRDFWMGKYAVTQAQYKALRRKNPSRFRGAWNPVETVSWKDAATFCAKLTEREAEAGRLPLGYEYRLPTEAEWEYAARGGVGSKGSTYSGSNTAGSVAWYNEDNERMTHVVGEKAPNELGLHDMSGNVWELCLDWYGSQYYRKTDGASDPVNLDAAPYRVMRGGSWVSSARGVRSASRFRDGSSYVGADLGFRVCLGPSVDWLRRASAERE